MLFVSVIVAEVELLMRLRFCKHVGEVKDSAMVKNVLMMEEESKCVRLFTCLVIVSVSFV